MPHKTFTNIAIPDELADEIDKIVKSKGLGYRNRPSFINEAIRKHLMDIKKLIIELKK